MRQPVPTLTLTLAFIALMAPGADAQVEFIRGDCNVDGVVTLADAMWAFRIHWCPGTAQPCLIACDANDDDVYNGLVDGAHIFGYLVQPGSPPIPLPFPNCGPDPTPGTLACNDGYDCTPPAPLPVDPDHTLSITPDTTGYTGGTATLEVLLDNENGLDVDGYSFGVCHNSTILDVAKVEEGSAWSDMYGYDATFASVSSYPGEGWTAAIIGAPLDCSVLPPGPDYQLALATYDLFEAGSEVLTLCDTLGTPPVAVSVIVGGAGVLPVTSSGQITIVDVTFVRGDCDGDGVFDGLLDGLKAVSFQFIPGTPEPPCLAACDANGDNNFNGVLDGIYILSFQFIPGNPPPPPPFPTCGNDPMSILVGCASPTCLP